MIDAIAGSHNEIVFRETIFTLEAFLAKQSDIIRLAISFAVAHKASTILVEKLTTFDTSQALGMPFEIGRHTQYKLVVYLIPTT